MNRGQLVYYCISEDCKSKNKIFKTLDDYLREHSHHFPQYKTFDELRSELEVINHPLKDAQMTYYNEDINFLIVSEITDLTKTFLLVISKLQQMLQTHASQNFVSLQELVKLYNAVIERNNVKIEEFQPLIPKLSISTQDIIDQQAKNIKVQKKVVEILKQVKDDISSFSSFTNQCLVRFKWSKTYKHPDTQIDGAIVSSQTKDWCINLIEPSFSVSDITKVRLIARKHSNLCIQLCDVNIAKDRQTTWNERLSEGDGTYTHQHTGEIYPHHLVYKQKSGMRMSFAFKEGEYLELEWNGPMRLFTTYNHSTQQKFAQYVQFSEEAELHFGVQMCGFNQVEIIQ